MILVNLSERQLLEKSLPDRETYTGLCDICHRQMTWFEEMSQSMLAHSGHTCTFQAALTMFLMFNMSCGFCYQEDNIIKWRDYDEWTNWLNSEIQC